MSNNKVIGMAHRGFSFSAPENTAASFRMAQETGIDGIETDVHLTKDGIPVIHHNYTVNSTSNGKGRISRMTLEELRALDFGSYKGKEFAGERILTLEELLELCSSFNVINVELKSPVKKDPAFVTTVLDCVEKSGLADRVMFSSFDSDLLFQVKKINSNYRVGLLTYPEGSGGMLLEALCSLFAMLPIPNADQILDSLPDHDLTLVEQVDALPFRPDYLHPSYTSVLRNPSLVEEMHSRGIGVNPWTCDNPEEMKALMDAGVDGIITNRPDLFLQTRDQK